MNDDHAQGAFLAGVGAAIVGGFGSKLAGNGTDGELILAGVSVGGYAIVIVTLAVSTIVYIARHLRWVS